MYSTFYANHTSLAGMRVLFAATVFLHLNSCDIQSAENGNAGNVLARIDELYVRAEQQRADGMVDEAIKTANQIISLQEQSQSAQRDLAQSLEYLVSLHTQRENVADAIVTQRRVLSVYEAAIGKRHWQTATARVQLKQFISLASLTKAQLQELDDVEIKFYRARESGNIEGAIILGKEVASLVSELLGEDSLNYADSLMLLAGLYRDQGMYTQAELLLKEVLVIYQKSFGPDHPVTAAHLNNLASVYYSQGEHRKAELLNKRSLRIKEKTLGPNDPGVANSMMNLATVYTEQGKYGEAEALLERALSIAEKAGSDQKALLSSVLYNLATLYKCQGKYAQAEVHLNRSLLIDESIHGSDHPLLVLGLNNLAVICCEQEKYAEAEVPLKRALAISELHLRPDHPSISACLNTLAVLFENQQKYAEAALSLKRALKINEKALGPNHPHLAVCLGNLGFMYMRQNRYEKAEPLFKRSFMISFNALGPDHPNVAIGAEHLGSLHNDIGEYRNAMMLLSFAVEIQLKQLEINAVVQSERQQLAAAMRMESLLMRYIDSCLNLNIKYGEAYRVLLDSKGVVTYRQQVMRSFTDRPVLDPLFEKLKSNSSQLSKLTTSNGPFEPEVRARKIRKLLNQKEVIEQQISRESQLFRKAIQEVRIEKLQDSLPQNSAMLDFCIYDRKLKPVDDQTKSKGRQNRIAAFIVRPEGSIELVNLCSYEDFQRALATWKQNLLQSTGPATALGKLIWEPLAEYVDDVELVLYSPIAELGSVPFAALPGKEPGSYLIEDKQLVMIPQAKLLPSLLEREESTKPTVLAVGGVNYNRVGENESRESVPLAASRRAVRWQGQKPFDRLTGTEEELASLEGIYGKQFNLGKLQTLKDDRATEAAVKRLAPQYSHLHFATHGFFAPPEVKSALDHSNNRFEQQLRFDDQPRVTGFHPGLLSGLALAGANDPPEEGEDGIWTAEEVATMNLSNVDLAVLSACETGLGKVAGGEGLLGLQRAFQVSGAGTTVASLWQVDDAATRALMTEFYRNLWEKKLPKIEALRQAQLTMLREYDPQAGKLRGVGGKGVPGPQSDSLPPFYWAAWVLSGDWR